MTFMIFTGTLFRDCDIIIYNGDDEEVCESVDRTLQSAREIAWSRRDADKPLFISSVKMGLKHGLKKRLLHHFCTFHA